MQRSTVASLLRTTQAFCSQLCEKETLQYGIAYYSHHFAALPEANQFREVCVDDPARIEQAYREAEQAFARQDLFCYRWAPAADRTIDGLEGFLAGQGFRPRRFTALTLVRWVDLQADTRVRVVPARAARAAFRETFFLTLEATGSAAAHEMTAEAYGQRLDDPQMDMFVALVDQAPAGRCALFQVGDIGRIMDLSATQSVVDNAVRRTLLAHVLALAKRLLMRNICVQIDGGVDPAEQAWWEAAGFVPDGTIVEFEREFPGRV